MRTKLGVALAILGLFSALSVAAPNAVVDVVQAPAWVERDGRRMAMAPGMVLENRDRILTGTRARAIVQLADGSAVKLGENSNVALNALRQPENGVFTAALDVVKGAFRLTTDIFRKHQTQRAINVRSGTVTIGIRGTDLWGRASDEKDFVCLIEGRISVTHPLGEAAELTEPLQYYGADKGMAPGPVASVDKGQLGVWALETELLSDVAVRRHDGRWRLHFSQHDKEGVLALYDQLANAGYASRIVPVRVSGGYRYGLRLDGIVTEREALALADRLARDLHIPAPTVRRR